MIERIEALSSAVEEPLLVSNLVNVRYLTGFDSSNAALVVEPERVRLFSDFRYAELGRSIQGVEFIETKRSLYAALAELLEGQHGFEADDLTYGKWETLRPAGSSSSRAAVSSRLCARSRTSRSSRRFGGPRRIAERGVCPLRRGDVPWANRARPRLAHGRAIPRARGRGPRVRDDRRSRPERRAPALAPQRPRGRPGRDRGRRLGCAARRLLLRLHAHLRHGAAARAAAGGVRGVPRGAARRARGGASGSDGRRSGRGCSARDRERRLRRGIRPRPRARGRAWTCTRRRDSRASHRTRW